VFRVGWILIFYLYKLCLAEVEDFINLSRILRYPAARLRVAVAGLLAILDLSHPQGSALQHTHGPGDFSLLCVSTIIPASEITMPAPINCTEHTHRMLPGNTAYTAPINRFLQD